MILLRRRHTEELGLYEDLRVNYQRRYSKCANLLLTIDDIHVVMKHFMGDYYYASTEINNEYLLIEQLPSTPSQRFQMAKRYIKEYKRMHLKVRFN
mgnify:FL=1